MPLRFRYQVMRWLPGAPPHCAVSYPFLWIPRWIFGANDDDSEALRATVREIQEAGGSVWLSDVWRGRAWSLPHMRRKA